MKNRKVKCKIIPNNKRLKQLVKEYGEIWYVISPIKRFICFNNELGVTVESLNGEHERHVQYPDQIQILETKYKN